MNRQLPFGIDDLVARALSRRRRVSPRTSSTVLIVASATLGVLTAGTFTAASLLL